MCVFVCIVHIFHFPVANKQISNVYFFCSLQMNDKDSPSETEADTTDQLASKQLQQQQQQHSQSKLLSNKEQQSSGLADDAQLTIALQSAADAMQSQSQQNKVNADAFYPEANFVNASDSQVNTQQEHELETRLK